MPIRRLHLTGLRRVRRSLIPLILDPQRAAREVKAVVPQRNTERPGQVPRTAAQIVQREVRGALRARGAPSSHERDTVLGFERADQDGCRPSLRFGHRVDQMMDAVVQIHVGDTRRAVQRRVARRRTRRGMARRIALPDVRLGLDDDPRRQAVARLVDEHLADEIARDLQGRAVVKRAREDHDGATQPLRAATGCARSPASQRPRPPWRSGPWRRPPARESSRRRR